MWAIAIRSCLFISMLAACAAPVIAQHEYTSSEIEAGRQQYAANCTRCHGPDGDNVANADIGHGKFRRASTDNDIVKLIQNGIPNTAMAAMSNINDATAQ